MGRLLRSFHLRTVAGYGVLAGLFSWPLPLHLRTHLLGVPGGDTGVYVWNLWVFSHELLENHRLPFFTSAIFSLDSRADLSLHNYTAFADLLAVPLIPLVGVVGAFNLLYLLMVVINGYAMCLLAREVGAGKWESWLGGALFAFAPCLVARSTEHFSLVMAAPVVVFAWVLQRAERQPLWVTGLASGSVFAWAALCDPYYGIYCLVLAGWHLASRCVSVRFVRRDAPSPRATRPLTAAIAGVGLLVAWIALTGGASTRVFGVALDVRTLYTPVLVLTLLVLLRLLCWRRLELARRVPPWSPPILRSAAYGMASCAVLLSPLLYAFGTRVADGRYVSAPVMWRTSMPGIDLLSLVAPNPNHPLFRSLAHGWLARQPNGFAENVASLTFVALIVLVIAVVYARFRPPRYWLALGVFATAVAAGPFIRIASVTTCVPTPWALLRYAPLVGGARAPARFMVVVMLVMAVLFALALTALARRFPTMHRSLLSVVTVVLLFELLPAPRVLYSAEVPAIYQRIAADARHVRVLELPFGVRSGLSSVGDFSAITQFYQTAHHKRLIGGYLSRVSPRRVAAIRRRPILDALIELSEGRDLPEERISSLQLIAPSFVRGARLGYVVVDRTRASQSLVAFAVRTLRLEKIATSGERDLYRPMPQQ